MTAGTRAAREKILKLVFTLHRGRGPNVWEEQ